MIPKRNLRFVVPPPGATESFEMVDAGPPLTPEQVVEYYRSRGLPHPKRPLVPTADEVAALPRTARQAFLARCAARVAPLAPAAAEIDAQQAAALILAAATVQTPVRRLLRCIRRDFDKLVYLAKQRKWTDDTPVPPDALGPLWPEDVKLPWAKG
jgi:hypothetical protein